MRKILLKSVPFDGEAAKAEPEMLNYRKMIEDLLLIPLDPKAGMKYDEMSKVLPLHAKIKALPAKAKDFLAEEEEHKTIVARLKNAPFVKATYAVRDFIESVRDSGEIEPEEKKKSGKENEGKD